MAVVLKPKRGTNTPGTDDIVSGEIAIDTSAKKLYINDGGTVKEIGGAGGSTTEVTQSSHGFSAKDCIRHNGSSWVKAQADSASTLALGVVTEVADSNTFTVAQSGRFTISSHGLTVGQWYYLDASTAGALTATEPTISQPLVYVESASVVFVFPYRPTQLLVNGGASVVPGDNTVTSAKIVDGTIVTADLADDAVTTAKIADDAITSALIADDAVVTAAIADDAITSALIADDAVTSALIADNTITVGNMAAGTLKTPGSNNIAIGTNSLVDGSLSGQWNLGVGIDTLKENEGGLYNTAVGMKVLQASTSANYNTAVGYAAGYDITTGGYNSIVGFGAGENLTTGAANQFFGMYSGYTTTDANYCTGIGYQALYTMGTSSHNIAIGHQSQYSCTTGHSNIAIGMSSLYTNNEGFYNTAVGTSTLPYNTDGDYNTAVGVQSGYSNTTGYNQVFLGGYAGYAATDGNSNTCVGYTSGYGITTGDNNITIGASAGRANSPSGNITTGDNIVCIGNDSIGAAYCKQSFSTGSDERDKADITDFTYGLSWINKMRPVTYKWDMRSDYLDEDDEEQDITKVTRDGSKKNSKIHIGLIAQEVLEIEKADNFATNTDNELLVSSTKDGTAIGLQYERVVPVLINAIKELEARIKVLEG